MKNKDQDFERVKQWRKQNPAQVSRYNWTSKLNRLGITAQDYVDLLAKQNGKCAIVACDKPADHIDHDHKTGKVRGLLCGGCNKALGFFDDDPIMLIAAARYLRGQRQRVPLIRLTRRAMNDVDRQIVSDRMKGNKYALGGKGRPGPRSAEELEKMSIRGKERWAKMTEKGYATACERVKGNRGTVGNRASTGQVFSAERRAKISAQTRRHWEQLSPEEQELWRERGRNGARTSGGRPGSRSEEEKAKQSIKAKERWEKMRDAEKKRWLGWRNTIGKNGSNNVRKT